MALFVVRIVGANASESWCSALDTHGRATRLVAHTSGSPKPAALRWQDGKAALFPSREEARAAGLAAVWNGQRFMVEPARGSTRECGRVIQIEGKWTSCQEAVAW